MPVVSSDETAYDQAARRADELNQKLSDVEAWLQSCGSLGLVEVRTELERRLQEALQAPPGD